MLMKLAFLTHFKKSPDIRFHENPSCDSRAVPYGRKDGRENSHDEDKSRFSQNCERD